MSSIVLPRKPTERDPQLMRVSKLLTAKRIVTQNGLSNPVPLLWVSHDKKAAVS